VETQTVDRGFRAIELWWAAWVLGVVGLGAAAVCALVLDVDSPLWQVVLWSGIAVLATIWSPACAVIATVKAAEARTRALLVRSNARSSR
jgi:hypothetical protein